MSRVLPQVGAWFKNVVEDQTFEVVAFDEDEEQIGIQFETGEIEELDLDTWHEMAITEIAAPEDWDGAFEDTEMDDKERRSAKRFAMEEEEGWEGETVDELGLGDEDEF
ncbi:MAG: hypothetical protein HYV16_10005 [Gammaproteobacteria bacterium]|nr:hypothetical protein [Gammaproteobacteria bacterium]